MVLALSLGSALLLAVGFGTGWFIQRDHAQTPNPYDVGYLQDMTEHHAQAVAMSLTLLDRDVSPGGREAARRILLSQQGDIGVMQGWLQQWGEPEQNDSPMAWMSAAGHGHGMADAESSALPSALPSDMPGAVSSAEMSSLASARDDEVEAAFLDLMVDHHTGALKMARVARDHAATDAVRGLAARTISTQEMEIAQLGALRDLLAQ